jgi:hypothetical protein
MLKCDLQYDIVSLRIKIYLYDKNYYYKLINDKEYEALEYKSYSVDNGLKPFISIPYDFAEIIFPAISEYHTKRKLEDGSVVSAKDLHIKDLNKVLDHFLKKDDNT